MDEETETVDAQEKTCAICNREGMLALFGVVLGVVFIAMGLDTLRRMRKETEVQ